MTSRDPNEAAALFPGTVMHARLRPAGHRFDYRVMNLFIDIDRLAEADRMSPLFSVGRFNLWSFREKDHGPGDGTPLRRWIDGLLAGAGVDLAGGRVRLLCYPRLLGFVFDPLSVYYCEARDGTPAAIVYAVRNTFGERHAYVCPVRPGELSAAGVRQEADKRFYVSPFNPMRQRYLFRLKPPGDTLTVRILETDADGPILAATFSGVRRDLTSRALLAAFLAMPLMTLKIVAGIHYEAFRLWRKGVPLTLSDRPAAPPQASVDGVFVASSGEAAGRPPAARSDHPIQAPAR